MRVPCTIRIDYTAGAAPNTVQATVNYVGPDGSVLQAEEPNPVKAGQSLTMGPVDVEVTLSTKAEHADTPKKGKPQEKKTDKPAA